MNISKAALPLALAVLSAAPALAQTATPRQPAAVQQARVQAARETAQVRLLERTSQLRPARVSASCNARLTVLADAKGTPRLVRYNSPRPDNSVQFSGYYDAAGNLRYATASASGLAGVLYDLSAEYDARGRLLQETGLRRPGYAAELRRMPNLNVELLRRGLCPL